MCGYLTQLRELLVYMRSLGLGVFNAKFIEQAFLSHNVACQRDLNWKRLAQKNGQEKTHF